MVPVIARAKLIREPAAVCWRYEKVHGHCVHDYICHFVTGSCLKATKPFHLSSPRHHRLPPSLLFQCAKSAISTIPSYLGLINGPQPRIHDRIQVATTMEPAVVVWYRQSYHTPDCFASYVRTTLLIYRRRSSGRIFRKALRRGSQYGKTS